MDKPIIFSAPMIRALLDGRKTQTRRVISQKMLDDYYEYDEWCRNVSAGVPTSRQFERGFFADHIRYAPGDRLWVREAHTRGDKHKFMVAYRADGECGAWGWDGNGKPIFNRHGTVLEASSEGNWGYARYGGKWRSPIHMPRWASRLTLTVTDVRVQRLQDIKYADLIAEGIEATDIHARRQQQCRDHNIECGSVCRDSFQELWNSLHGPSAWDANPWVCAITFDVTRGNIDQIGGAA